MLKLFELVKLEQSDSPGASKNAFVPKNDSSTPVTREVQALKIVSVANAYHLKHVPTNVTRLFLGNFSSKIDLKTGSTRQSWMRSPSPY